ncbi:TPA: ash family protein [Salmonella enterica]|nr:ash family protein [Salmonella enterica]EJC5509679.1 ash family protein [Salmonella enterica]HAK6118019.1 ash family protein [Salmonella enterica]
MTTYKNRLPQSVRMGYISPAPHKTGAGISPPLFNKAHNRASGFFTCKASSHPQIMVGRMGQPQGWPGSLLTGRTNPVRLTTPGLVPLVGELSQLINKGYPSWQTVNHAIPALTRTASILKPKSAAASVEPIRWHIICQSICGACPLTSRLCGCRQSWIISPTICRTFSNCCTYRKTKSNSPENLTQKQHSASVCWWGVCLSESDIQEAL